MQANAKSQFYKDIDKPKTDPDFEKDNKGFVRPVYEPYEQKALYYVQEEEDDFEEEQPDAVFEQPYETVTTIAHGVSLA